MDADRRRVEPWPVALALALLAMIGSSVAFFVIASRHPDPVVVGDVHEAGLRLVEGAGERARARALGVDLDLRLGAAPGTALPVEVRANGPDGALVPERVVVRRVRPAEGGLDRDFELRPADGSAGRFRGEVELPRAGRWELHVTATVAGLPVQERFALVAERGRHGR